MKFSSDKQFVWTATFIGGGSSALAVLLARDAYQILTQNRVVGLVFLVGTGFLIAANGAFVFWTVNRLVTPLRKLLDHAQAAGISEPDVQETSPLQPQQDAVSQLSDFCARVSEALPALEAHRLFPEVVCQSREMRNVLTVVRRAAVSNTTILLLGESGTGKELISRSIHRQSLRKGAPFVAVNCAAIPEALIESELFGHEKGAFTGAVSQRKGAFELAHGGTILLDEIGELPLNMQAKLLRVLQERTIQRVGGTAQINVDVRIIAATNRDLAAMVNDGRFREDLFYRLNVLPIRLPPLRERIEDIPLLVKAFITRKIDSPIRIAPDTMRFLMAYDWPGNVRELENALEAALTLADTVIEPIHLPPQVAPDPLNVPVARGGRVSIEELSAPGTVVPIAAEIKEKTGAETPEQILPKTPEYDSCQSLDEQLAGLEQSRIIDALRLTNGIQVDAARLLGIKERSLWHRIKKYDIDVDALKCPEMKG